MAKPKQVYITYPPSFDEKMKTALDTVAEDVEKIYRPCPMLNSNNWYCSTESHCAGCPNKQCEFVEPPRPIPAEIAEIMEWQETLKPKGDEDVRI